MFKGSSGFRNKFSFLSINLMRKPSFKKKKTSINVETISVELDAVQHPHIHHGPTTMGWHQ